MARAATFRMSTWTSGLTLGTNSGIPRGPLAGTTRHMAGTTSLGGTSGPMAGATRLGGASGPMAGAATFRMSTWTSGLTLGINAGIPRGPLAGTTRLGGPLAGTTRLGGPMAGTTRLGGTPGGQA